VFRGWITYKMKTYKINWTSWLLTHHALSIIH
jgi:hypothetical protein